MRREDRFVMSHKPYAVDLSSLREERGFYRVDAVWFRRRRRGGYGPNGAVVTVACVGNLHTGQRPAPSTAREFLERYDDGRYGGDCQGRWDGTGYWGSQRPETMTEHLDLLRPALDGYLRDPEAPQAPEGYDGWWAFRT